MKRLIFLLTLLVLGATVSPLIPEKYDYRIVLVEGPGWSGTAFYVQAPSGKNYLVTNAHVCNNQKFLISFDGKKIYTDVVIMQSSLYDLCALLPRHDVKGFKLSNSYSDMEPVTVIGYPLGVRATTHGLLSQLWYLPEMGNFYFEITAFIDHGSSGSPVIDKDGKVIGVISLKALTGFGEAVPVGFIKDLLRNL